MSGEVLLEVQDVTKRFGGLMALSHVHLELHQGEILGLIGPNGAGKTTLFNIISGIYQPDAGHVLFRGRDITRLRPHQRCRLGIGRTLQITKPFLGLSLLENVTVGSYFGHGEPTTLQTARQRASATLDLVGLGRRKDEMANSLTLGERKKLDMARALGTQPDVLLLDEVVAGLNPSEVAEMLKVIRHVRDSGVTVLMIEHVMKAVMEVSERVKVLHYGEILAEGTPEAVVHDDRVITAYLGDAADALA
jgi:branched-chain amino acid transport system ATP-binding protein